MKNQPSGKNTTGNHGDKLPAETHVLDRYGLPGTSAEHLFDLLNIQHAMFLADILDTYSNFGERDPEPFMKYPVPMLTDYIERSHRHYVSKRLPEIEQSLSILLENNHYTHPSLHIICNFFQHYKHELNEHFRMEEKVLLPYANMLYNAFHNRGGLLVSMVHFNRYSVEDFIQHHHHIDTLFRRVRTSILRYDPPVTNLSPHRILLNQMKSFEEDLNIHEMIEDQVLVPKLRSMEKRLKNLFETTDGNHFANN
ncbi:MAG: hypothetical protein H6585_05625 [Flavobacteriales bacterium]|nr:hypothetical protein [Flavobacteriales bacterium]MCB9447810.1 hypothetical protein [Flavobacteriales bacterium]